jgi:hypothetical protein
MLLKLYFNADPDPAFHSNADPDSAKLGATLLSNSSGSFKQISYDFGQKV